MAWATTPACVASTVAPYPASRARDRVGAPQQRRALGQAQREALRRVDERLAARAVALGLGVETVGEHVEVEVEQVQRPGDGETGGQHRRGVEAVEVLPPHAERHPGHDGEGPARARGGRGPLARAAEHDVGPAADGAVHGLGHVRLDRVALAPAVGGHDDVERPEPRRRHPGDDHRERGRRRQERGEQAARGLGGARAGQQDQRARAQAGELVGHTGVAGGRPRRAHLGARGRHRAQHPVVVGGEQARLVGEEGVVEHALTPALRWPVPRSPRTTAGPGCRR